MYLDNKTVLHIHEKAKNFQNATFLRSKSAEDIWQDFLEYRTTFYTGFSEKVRLGLE